MTRKTQRPKLNQGNESGKSKKKVNDGKNVHVNKYANQVGNRKASSVENERDRLKKQSAETKKRVKTAERESRNSPYTWGLW